MVDLDDIYNTRILELAGSTTRAARLSHPDATVTAQSKLCGSTITIDMTADMSAGVGRVTDYGQSVKACLLGQASAAVMAQEIVGSSFGELRTIAAQTRAMLKDGAPPPTGRFADLAVLEPVRAYKARHASTLLVFDAIEQAMAQIEAAAAEVESVAMPSVAQSVANADN